jgi:ATP-dependent DNA helicase RecQ
VREVAEAVRRSGTTLVELTRHGSRRKITGIVNLLESAGIVRTSRDAVRYADDAPPPDEAVEAAAQQAERQVRRDRSRIEVMREYAGTRGCRRRFLLGYFGQELDGPCGRCDEGLPTADAQASEYPPNSPVRHEKWGHGVVVHHEDDRIMVLFDEVGYKTLSLAALNGTGILTVQPRSGSSDTE